MKKTTADVPPQVAKEYSKAPRPQAISEATGDGYTKTKTMQKGMKQKSQFGLPKSPGKPMPMGRTTGKAAEREMAGMEREAANKGPGLHLRISVRPDDKM